MKRKPAKGNTLLCIHSNTLENEIIYSKSIMGSKVEQAKWDLKAGKRERYLQMNKMS